MHLFPCALGFKLILSTVMGLSILVCPIPSAFCEEEPEESNRIDDLLEMDIEDLLDMEVTVASKKSEPSNKAPGIITVSSEEELKLYGDRNLHQFLQRQPSVFARGSYMYPNNLASFRGDMPTHLDLHTLVLFNGRPIRESGFGGTNFPIYMTFPMAGLGSIELVRGPGSVLYGTNAFTGIVNLKSMEIPEQDRYSISSMAGSHGYNDTSLTAGGRFGDFGYVTTVRMADQTGYTYGLTDETGAYNKKRDRFNSISSTMHMEYRGFTFDFFGTHLQTFHLGVLPRWAVPEHEYRVNKIFANAGYSLPLNDIMDLDFNLTYNLQENDFAGFPTGKVDINSSDLIGEVTLSVSPTEDIYTVIGYLRESHSSFKEDDGDYNSVSHYRRDPQSVYAQGDYQVNEYVKVIGGTQWNHPDRGYSDTISRFGIIITPVDNWGIKLLRGEAFRAPFALETDLYDVPVLVGNKNLDPETITTYDAQIFYNDEMTYTAVTAFNNTIDDLIIRDNSVSPSSFKNGGEQSFRGIEFETKHYLTQHWHMIGSYMYQKNREDDDITPSTSPEYMVKLGTGYTWDWGMASLFMSHYAKPPRLKTELVVNPEPDALSLLSLNLDVDPAEWLGMDPGRSRISFRVENLLNEEINVVEFNRGGRPNSIPDGPGRTFFLGLTLNF